jgi:hypothetical protein
MAVNNISGIQYQPQIIKAGKTSLIHLSHPTDSVSFSGNSQLKGLEKTKVKLQRIAFNWFDHINNKLNEKVMALVSKTERQRIYPLGKEQAKSYCALTGAELVSPINLRSKADNSQITGYVVIRKLKPDIDYTKQASLSLNGTLINAIIQDRVKQTKKGDSTLAKVLGYPKGHCQITENSALIEVLDNYGIPIGTHFLDINKDGIISKGVRNYEPDSIAGVGRILNDVKSLSAYLNRSKRVSMPSTDKSKGFHIKCGYRPDPIKKPCGAGDWMHLPEEQLAQIIEKYKDSELYTGLMTALTNLGLI